MRGTENTRSGARRGTKAYLAASIAAQICALARYTLLARILGPDQLGIAVALILTAQFFESVTDSGSDRFLVQDKDGDEPDVQRLAHLVWIGRGLFIAAGLALLAVPLAGFYGEPQLRTGFLLLAVSPLVAGFVHLDFRRQQRRSDFRGESWVLLISEFASLAVTGIAAWILRDYTAVIYGLITRSVAMVLVSQLKAERRYKFGFSKAHAGRLAAFASPLMLNGLLLFLSSQGDRLLIGKEVGLTELGYYSAALLLIYYPTGILQRYITNMHLPLLASAEQGSAKQAAADRLGGQTLLLSVVMAAGYAVVAPWMIVIFYGQAFAQPALLVAAVGVLQTARFLRLWPVTVALALGHSRTVLVSNLLRLLAFPAAFIGMEVLGSLFGILLGFATMEALSLLVTTLIISRHLSAPPRTGLDRVAVFVLSSAAIIGWAALAGSSSQGLAFILLPLTLALIVWLVRREANTIREAMLLLRPKRIRPQKE